MCIMNKIISAVKLIKNENALFIFLLLEILYYVLRNSKTLYIVPKIYYIKF